MDTASYKKLLANAKQELQPPTWETPEDLARMSVESMVTAREGDARSMPSQGVLRLHGDGVTGHRADLDSIGAISRAWQKAVSAFGASLEGVKQSRGRLSAGILNRTRLDLVATPGIGSLILSIEPAMDALEELAPAGTKTLFDPNSPSLEDERPLADRATSGLIELSSEMAQTDLADLDRLSDSLRTFGPRVASSLRELADALGRSEITLDASWEEPSVATRRSTWTAEQARWIKKFIEGRELDSEEITIEGIAETVSDSEPWLIITSEEDMRISATELSPTERRSVGVKQHVRLLVRATPRVRPSGVTTYTYTALRIVE